MAVLSDNPITYGYGSLTDTIDLQYNAWGKEYGWGARGMDFNCLFFTLMFLGWSGAVVAVS